MVQYNKEWLNHCIADLVDEIYQPIGSVMHPSHGIETIPDYTAFIDDIIVDHILTPDKILTFPMEELMQVGEFNLYNSKEQLTEYVMGCHIILVLYHLADDQNTQRAIVMTQTNKVQSIQCFRGKALYSEADLPARLEHCNVSAIRSTEVAFVKDHILHREGLPALYETEEDECYHTITKDLAYWQDGVLITNAHTTYNTAGGKLRLMSEDVSAMHSDKQIESMWHQIDLKPTLSA